MTAPNDPFNAFVAGPEAPAAGSGAGPLAGLTFAVKDIYDVKGQRTGGGNPQKLAEAVPAAETAPAVQKLLDAGAALVGRTQTDELTFSLMGQNAHYPWPVNPAAPGRVTGGSSSGSAAAVAGGLVDFATGSDTGGSIRGPASFCGLIGLRTTHGAIPLDGAMPLAPTFDTFGWFARDAEIYEKVGQVVLGGFLPPPGEVPSAARRRGLPPPTRPATGRTPSPKGGGKTSRARSACPPSKTSSLAPPKRLSTGALRALSRMFSASPPTQSHSPNRSTSSTGPSASCRPTKPGRFTGRGYQRRSAISARA